MVHGWLSGHCDAAIGDRKHQVAEDAEISWVYLFLFEVLLLVHSDHGDLVVSLPGRDLRDTSRLVVHGKEHPAMMRRAPKERNWKSRTGED